jgi:hypothetical protein
VKFTHAGAITPTYHDAMIRGRPATLGPLGASLLLAVALTACSVDRLSVASDAPVRPSLSGTGPTATPLPATPRPTQATDGGRPTPTAAALLEPPYVLDNGGYPQSPGTIEFGTWQPNGRLAPYSGFPYGFGIDQDLGFGAYWGYPAPTPAITITLYELVADAWTVVWSDVKPVDSADGGFADTLVRFQRPGLYRLDVTAGTELLASSLMRMAPPCAVDCSGG